MFKYLAVIQSLETEEPNTGRYESKKPFSKKIQLNAANGAWDEVFSSLKSGVIRDEPYLTIPRLEQFFRDTRLVLIDIKSPKT